MNDQPYQNKGDAPEHSVRQMPMETSNDASKVEAYTYRWSYEEQAAYDRKERKRRRGRGAGVYAVVMSVAFLLCLCVLGGVLLINRMEGPPEISTAEIAETVNPGTVLIYASSSTKYGYGTGFFVRSDGYIVTNYHVIENANVIMVTLYSGEELEATFQWGSRYDDLALLKVEGENFPTLAIGDSSALAIGDRAVAIGNPAGNVCPWTVTQGIISAVNRQVTVEESNAILDLKMIQTDAQVNPGNSGGPLCNGRGEVIGIVTRKMSEYEGLGLAIPINGAMELVNAYLTTGSTENVVSTISRVRPTIGIHASTVRQGEDITSSYKAPMDGVLVVSVNDNSAADGILEAGDIILYLDGVRLTDMEQLRELLYRYRAGDTVKIQLDRFGKRMELSVILGTASQ